MKLTVAGLAGSIESWLGIMAFASMFFAIVVQVFFRYVLGDPLIWPFEFSVFCYIYVIYIGSVMAARKQSHISFNILYDSLPGHIRLSLGVITNSFVAVIFLATIPSSIGYISLIGAVPSSSMSIPWGAVLAVFPLGMGLISLTLGLRAYRDAIQLIGRKGL